MSFKTFGVGLFLLFLFLFCLTWFPGFPFHNELEAQSERCVGLACPIQDWRPMFLIVFVSVGVLVAVAESAKYGGGRAWLDRLGALFLLNTIGGALFLLDLCKSPVAEMVRLQSGLLRERLDAQERAAVARLKKFL